jgi:ABC-type multidrug transport system ATPase subunit
VDAILPGEEAEMIELQQVTKEYAPAPGRSVLALAEVTLAVPRGEVWAVVGPNGAGKTTLFGLVLGFLEPTAGTVRLGGLAPRAYLRRHGAAFLPERFRLPGEWTVRGALRALGRLEGLAGNAANARAALLLERFGLAPHATKRLSALSRGLLQRVGLAQALLAERELVVLDEPTEGLDPLWRVQFRDVVKELHQGGRTVLIASHDLGEVERMADRALLLDGGSIRELLDVRRPHPGVERYCITLARPAAALAELFPDARAEGEGDGGGARYHVTVTDAEELSARLAALLARGATLIAVAPVTEPLEARVQRALSGGGDA